MTVLCLVARDGDGVADVSLRALAFGRDLAATSQDGLAAVVFGRWPSPPGRRWRRPG